jgi:hypothetical protein
MAYASPRRVLLHAKPACFLSPTFTYSMNPQRHPHCLLMLDLLRSERFRKSIAVVQVAVSRLHPLVLQSSR